VSTCASVPLRRINGERVIEMDVAVRENKIVLLWQVITTHTQSYECTHAYTVNA
jgi:hypothetical protein